MMKAIQHTLIRRLTLPTFYFSSSLDKMKECLAKELYSIELINKQVNRRILSMAYSPGVG